MGYSLARGPLPSDSLPPDWSKVHFALLQGIPNFSAESVRWVKNSHLFFWQKAGSQVNIHVAQKFPCSFSGSRSRQWIFPRTVHDYLDHRSTEHSRTFWSRKRHYTFEYLLLSSPMDRGHLSRWMEFHVCEFWLAGTLPMTNDKPSHDNLMISYCYVYLPYNLDIGIFGSSLHEKKSCDYAEIQLNYQFFLIS